MKETDSFGAKFWEDNYTSGGNSGAGSYGCSATFKARVLNKFVDDHSIESVIEFGCGDGNQLALIGYKDYTGYDISRMAVQLCRFKFKGMDNRQFYHTTDYDGRTADLVLSLDVIYHIIEDEVFYAYMNRLFAAADRYVIIYAVDEDIHPKDREPHMYHRRFTDWVVEHHKEFELKDTVVNPCGYMTNFYIYERVNAR